MVEKRADLDYGGDDTTLVDDLTHQPSLEDDVLIVDETIVDDGSAESRILEDEPINPEASNYGSP